jgi:hypothetical protein
MRRICCAVPLVTSIATSCTVERRFVMTPTELLIEEIQSRAGLSGEWYITTDELADRFDPVDLYRALYATSQVSVDRYGPENVGELLVLLERLSGRDYRSMFRDSGLFLTHEDRIDLTERFVRTVRHAVVLHTPEPETFRAMVRKLKRYDRARQVYLSTFFDFDDLVEQCVAEYLDLRSAPALGSTVRSYLRLLLQRHIVDLEDIAPALLDILRTVARHEGALPRGRGRRDATAGHDEEGRAGHADREPGYPRDGAAARIEALRVLGLRTDDPPRAEVRDRYRALMRRYHPDVNPEGLERAKAINNAYAVLITDPGRCS